MNFQQQYKEGKEGKNLGLKTDIPKLTRAILGIRKKMIYAIGAGPKVGKSKFVNANFIIAPYEQCLEEGTLDDIEWIYYSFEMDRVSTEFEFTAHYFARLYSIYNFSHKGKLYSMCSSYLMGKLLDEDEELIPVSEEHFAIMKEIYINKIIPLFGVWDANTGKQVQKGKIDFIEERENPTGLRNYLMKYARANGEFITDTYYTEETDDSGRRKKVKKDRIVGYKENNPRKKTIIITDTMRKLKLERNYQMKQNVDKWVEYQVELRNWCKFTFVDIIHINRNLSAVERLKHAGEFIYPTGDDFKDTGNLSEEANAIITLFNANDEKYGLEKHFGLELVNYPCYRSIHLVESRDTECPKHIQTNMYGAVGIFKQIE